MASKYVLCGAVLGALVAVGLSSSAALACKGPTTILRDDFTEEDPAWDISDRNADQIGDGVLKVKTEPGKFLNLLYQGMNFPGADACIDIIAPPALGKTPSQGGLGLWTGRGWNFIFIASDGTAGVQGLQDGSWVTPVPTRKFDAIKTAPNAVNQLRAVWKAPPDSNSATAPDPYIMVFINDKPFIKYKAVPNANRAVAIYADTEGAVYQFKNLAITQ